MFLLRKKGFSLIEVLIALSILAGSLMVVSMAWSTNSLRLKKMKLNNQVSYLLDYKVSEFERKYKEQFTMIPDEDSGDFSDLSNDYKDFSWTMTSKKFELPNLTPLLSQQNDGANAMLATLLDQLTEFFNQAVKEVTVTVIYRVKNKSIKYTASTFLIDYNQQLPIPNLGGGGP